jgi:hypothetical protein
MARFTKLLVIRSAMRDEGWERRGCSARSRWRDRKAENDGGLGDGEKHERELFAQF